MLLCAPIAASRQWADDIDEQLGLKRACLGGIELSDSGQLMLASREAWARA